MAASGKVNLSITTIRWQQHQSGKVWTGAFASALLDFGDAKLLDGSLVFAFDSLASRRLGYGHGHYRLTKFPRFLAQIDTRLHLVRH